MSVRCSGEGQSVPSGGAERLWDVGHARSRLALHMLRELCENGRSA